MFANPVIPPAVEPGHALIRTSYMATHTDAQLDRVLETFEQHRPQDGHHPRDPAHDLSRRCRSPGRARFVTRQPGLAAVGGGLRGPARGPGLLAGADLASMSVARGGGQAVRRGGDRSPGARPTCSRRTCKRLSPRRCGCGRSAPRSRAAAGEGRQPVHEERQAAEHRTGRKELDMRHGRRRQEADRRRAPCPLPADVDRDAGAVRRGPGRVHPLPVRALRGRPELGAAAGDGAEGLPRTRGRTPGSSSARSSCSSRGAAARWWAASPR